MNLKLYTHQRAFEDLWDEIHKARKNTKKVTVNKDDLEGLLMDHANLLDAMQSFRKFKYE